MLMFFEIFTASQSDLLLFGIMVLLTFFIYNIYDSFKRASLIDNDTSYRKDNEPLYHYFIFL